MEQKEVMDKLLSRKRSFRKNIKRQNGEASENPEDEE